MLHFTVFLIIGLYTASITGQTQVKYSSICSVPTCGSSNGGNNGNCGGSVPCYSFQSVNETICAPQTQCSLFDVCISGNRCATNTSICIINSCCSQSICMPRALASACVPSNTSGPSYTPSYITSTPPSISVATDNAPIPKAPLSSSIRLCENATWDPNYTVVSGSNGTIGNNETTFNNPTNIFIDNNNMIYVVDNGNYRIQRFNRTSAIGVTVAKTSPFRPKSIYVDGIGSIYSCEEAYGVTSYGRLQKYAQGNINGITLMGGVGMCGTAITQLCGCGGVYIDRQGLIYISDAPNSRILTYNVTAGSVKLIAGTNGIGGNQADQFYYPGAIYVDETQNLYVIDASNMRIQKFVPGNATGITAYSTNTYINNFYTAAIIGDSLRSLYLSGDSITRWTPNSANLSTVIDKSTAFPVVYYYYYPNYYVGVAFDTSGSLYTIASGMLLKFNLLSNTC